MTPAASHRARRPAWVACRGRALPACQRAQHQAGQRRARQGLGVSGRPLGEDRQRQFGGGQPVQHGGSLGQGSSWPALQQPGERAVTGQLRQPRCEPLLARVPGIPSMPAGPCPGAVRTARARPRVRDRTGERLHRAAQVRGETGRPQGQLDALAAEPTRRSRARLGGRAAARPPAAEPWSRRTASPPRRAAHPGRSEPGPGPPASSAHSRRLPAAAGPRQRPPGPVAGPARHHRAAREAARRWAAHHRADSPPAWSPPG